MRNIDFHLLSEGVKRLNACADKAAVILGKIPGLNELRSRVWDVIGAVREMEMESVFNEADVEINGSRPWDIQVHDAKFYQRVLSGGSLALGESYMDGWWDCKSLDQFAEKLISSGMNRRFGNLKSILPQIIRGKLAKVAGRFFARESVRPYEIDNNLYGHMLGRTMAYTSGYWPNAENLDEAQEAKFELICKKLELEPGMKVLDLGCGFGGFAKYAAEHYGAKVVGVNLATEQLKYAKDGCDGLDVEFLEMNYRDVEGRFDRIVTMGMVEHLRPENYRSFMEKVSGLLKDDGIFLYHGIGGNFSENAIDPFIDKYIFPNTVIPSAAQISTSVEGLFVMEDWHNFGADYDKTLMAWHKNFVENWGQINVDGGYDERFYRMWTYYLLMCAGNFRSRQSSQLWQVVFSKKGVKGGYEGRR